MPGHERFEELCALAASGQIAPGEWQELQEHVQACSSCAETLGDFGRIGADLLVEFSESVPSGFQAEMRSRFLDRMKREGTDLRPYPLAPASVPFRPRRAVLLAGLAAAVVLAVLVETYPRVRRETRRAAAQSTVPRIAAGSTEQPHAAVPAAELTEKPVAVIEPLESKQKALEAKLQAAKSQESVFESSLADLRLQLDSKNHELVAAQSECAATAQRLAQTRSALEQSASKLAAQEMQLAIARAQVDKLGERLAYETAEVERQKALLAAGKDGQSIIAARNLHIVDVYDTDGHGKRRSFGRAFYVENQELVFYAYDLSDLRHANAEFYAWGAGAGPGNAAMRLGILHNDGKSEQRWVLRYNDPSVLAKLDSIFVTAETSSNPEKPKGKRVLFAVLTGQPNHP